VQLRRLGTSRFAKAYTGRSTAAGAFVARLHPPRAGRWEYRLSVASTRRAQRAVTENRTVVARGTAATTRILGYDAAPASIVLGAQVIDDVAASPASRREFEVWTRAPGASAFTLVMSGRSSSAGAYRVVTTPDRAGTWKLKVVVRPSRTAASATSPVRDITVSPPPPAATPQPAQAKPTAVLLVAGQWPPPSPPVVTLSVGFAFAFNFSASTPSPGHQLTKATLDLGTGGEPAVIPFVAGPSWYYVAPYTTSGTWKVTLTVTDTSGATSDPVSVIVVLVDNPTVTFQGPDVMTVGVPATIDLNPRTPTGTAFRHYEIYIWGAGEDSYISGVTPPETITRTFSRAGTVFIDVYLQNDAGGQVYASTSFEVSGDKTTSVLEIDGQATGSVSATVDQPLWFWAGESFTTPDRSLVSATLDFGDGTSDSFSGPPDEWQVNHSYSAPGDYVAMLVVRDSTDGTASTSLTVQVSAAP
jgi:hypothetical protein